MGVATKLKWKRSINQLRFLHDEWELVNDISSEGALGFQSYYEEYCRDNNIDTHALNSQHADRVKDLFGKEEEPPEDPDEEEEIIPDGSLVLRDKDKPDVEKDEKYELSQEEQELHDSFRKVFLKLAMVLHPDKLDDTLSEAEKDERMEMFQKVKDAFEERRYFILLDCASKYNIALPKNYEQQVKWMKQEIFDIENDIGRQKVTYNYSFAECETDDQRDALVRKFLRQVFGSDFTENS